jgi:hypothetical protein
MNLTLISPVVPIMSFITKGNQKACVTFHFHISLVSLSLSCFLFNELTFWIEQVSYLMECSLVGVRLTIPHDWIQVMSSVLRIHFPILFVTQLNQDPVVRFPLESYLWLRVHPLNFLEQVANVWMPFLKPKGSNKYLYLSH